MRLIDLDDLGIGPRSASMFANAKAAEGWNELFSILDKQDEIDPVHAAGGCYCRECRMRQGCETEKTVLCGYHNCAMRKDDFCSLGKRKEDL